MINNIFYLCTANTEQGGNMYIWTIFIIYVPGSDATAVLIIQPTLVFPGLLVKEMQIMHFESSCLKNLLKYISFG